jgi:O-antigen ligase
MKPEQMPPWLTRTLLVGLGAILLLMPVHAFISTWGGTAIGPLWLWKSWKELVLAGLCLVTVGWLGFNLPILRSILKKPFVIVLVAYLLLSVFLAVLYRHENGTEAMLAGLAMNLRYLGVATLAYLVWCYGGLAQEWLTKASWFVVCAGLFVSVVGILQVLALPSDFLAHFGYQKGASIASHVFIDDNPDLLRAFATLRGPNDFGAFLILPVLLIVARFRSLPLWVSLVSLWFIGWALLLSGSRSAWIGMAVALGAYGFFQAGRFVSKKYLALVVAAVALLVAITLYAAVSVPVLRMAVFHSSPGDSSLTEGSTDTHIVSTVDGVKRVVENPLGCGVGCAGPASYYGGDAQISENYFVQIAEEVGVLGLLLFLLFVGMIAYTLYKRTPLTDLSPVLLASLVGYGVIGLLLHVWSDDPVSITWWMLTGAVIGYNERQQWTKSKSNSRSKT